MIATIPSDYEPFIQQMIATGRGQTTEDVVGWALGLAQRFDQQRAELRAAVQEGIDSGPGIPAEEFFAWLHEHAASVDSRIHEAT